VSQNKLDIANVPTAFLESNMRKDFLNTLCAEYTLTGDLLKPSTIESRLHLAYLHLGARQYAQAKEIIDWPPKENLSKESCDIVKRIITAPTDTSSSTVSSAAIALKTYYLFSDQLKRFVSSDDRVGQQKVDEVKRQARVSI
jgi:hypothetical protein